MKKIKNIDEALLLFEEYSIKQAIATEQGDYKSGNKYYNNIIKIVLFLKESESLNKLKPFINHSNIGVRLKTAYLLLPFLQKECEIILAQISKGEYGIHSFNAKTILEEWKKGSLTFPY